MFLEKKNDFGIGVVIFKPYCFQRQNFHSFCWKREKNWEHFDFNSIKKTFLSFSLFLNTLWYLQSNNDTSQISNSTMPLVHTVFISRTFFSFYFSQFHDQQNRKFCIYKDRQTFGGENIRVSFSIKLYVGGYTETILRKSNKVIKKGANDHIRYMIRYKKHIFHAE